MTLPSRAFLLGLTGDPTADSNVARVTAVIERAVMEAFAEGLRFGSNDAHPVTRLAEYTSVKAEIVARAILVYRGVTVFDLDPEREA